MRGVFRVTFQTYTHRFWVENHLKALKGICFILWVMGPYMNRTLTAKFGLLYMKYYSICVFVNLHACVWASMWLFNGVSIKFECINQVFASTLPLSECNYCTAENLSKIALLHLFLFLSRNISSSSACTQANAAVKCYFSSRSLLEYSLGQFFDFSSFTGFDNFTARCWRRDHLLINPGHTGISFPPQLPHHVLLSTHTPLSKTIPEKKYTKQKTSV